MNEKLHTELQQMKSCFTKDQNRAYSYAMAGQSLFITGGPGTGKSFLVKALIKMFEVTGKSVLAMAPTGIAAVNIGGATIHRTLGLKRGEVINANSMSIKGKKCPLLDKADVVIIDEISMVRMDLFELIAKCIRMSSNRTGNHIQLLVIGDFFQLPPVMQPETRDLLEQYYNMPVGRGYCFNSQEWENFGFTTVILTETVRQKDAGFIAALNELRVGDTSCLKYFNTLSKEDDRFPYLVNTNEQAEEINNLKINELREKYKCDPFLIKATVTGKVTTEMLVPEEIRLYPGTRVMLVVNDPGGRYQNGSCGTVTKIFTDRIEVQLDDGRRNVWVEAYTWKVMQSVVDEDGKICHEVCGTYTQLPLKLAYAITIHKAQGQTYANVNIDPACWEVAQLYVALTRVRTPEGVHLMRKIDPSAILTDKSVLGFYQKLKGDIQGNTFNNEITFDQDGKCSGATKVPIQNEKEKLEKKSRPRVGRPTPFQEGTKRIRVGADSADYIQELCRRQAAEGGKIRLIPEELDLCISDIFEKKIDLGNVTFMAVPLPLEGKIRRQIREYEREALKEK